MKKLLFPIAFLYSIVLFFRHKLFDWGIINSKKFDIPVICVGNLSLGGTGKTPHIEYLTRVLSTQYKTAIISRGYGRKSKGFVLADFNKTHEDIGDEPMQYFNEFNNVTVAVDENRVEGIEKLLHSENTPQIILLDDAYQHRFVKPGYNILLTDYHNIYKNDCLIPSGNLRDIKMAAKRANAIVVTKTPSILTFYDIKYLTKLINPLPHQKLFFSYVDFQNFKPMNEKSKKTDPTTTRNVLLFCGIANPYPLEDFLKRKYSNVTSIYFKDHHNFNSNDIDGILNKYNGIIGKNKIIITTEKDAMRLINSSYFCKFNNIPLFSVPIKVRFHNINNVIFNEEILKYVRQNS